LCAYSYQPYSNDEPLVVEGCSSRLMSAASRSVSWPSTGLLRPYSDADAEMLRAALNEAFADDPFYENATPERFRAFYLGARGFDPSLWLLAWDSEVLIGFVLAFPERAGDRTVG